MARLLPVVDTASLHRGQKTEYLHAEPTDAEHAARQLHEQLNQGHRAKMQSGNKKVRIHQHVFGTFLAYTVLEVIKISRFRLPRVLLTN